MPKFQITSTLLPINTIKLINEDFGFTTNTNSQIHILNLSECNIVNNYLRILAISGF